MMFMNEYEIEDALRRFEPTETPNLATAAAALARLCLWTNRNSDGWPYWSKPIRASAKLQTLINSVDRFDPVDASDKELRAALSPIKAFLTRQGVDHSLVIG